jgi:hypothetical protein
MQYMTSHCIICCSHSPPPPPGARPRARPRRPVAFLLFAFALFAFAVTYRAQSTSGGALQRLRCSLGLFGAAVKTRRSLLLLHCCVGCWLLVPGCMCCICLGSPGLELALAHAPAPRQRRTSSQRSSATTHQCALSASLALQISASTSTYKSSCRAFRSARSCLHMRVLFLPWSEGLRCRTRC